MKIFRSISVNSNVCPSAIYRDLVRQWPQGVKHLTFHVEAKPGDLKGAEEVEQVLAFCMERGLNKLHGAYSYALVPHYETSDLEAAALLWVRGQRKKSKGPNSNRRDERGRIVLPVSWARSTIKVASIFPEPWIVVSNATRRVLESSGLLGLKFEEVAIGCHPSRALREPFWELLSTVVLPKMTNSVIHEDWGWAPFTIDDIYAEPHYRQQDLQPLGRFDVAQSFERTRQGWRNLIVSQAFFRRCQTNLIPLEVTPIRIDDV